MRDRTERDSPTRDDVIGRVSDLALRVGHEFSDPGLLERAVTHRSWCAENDGAVSNERLEFLGDAVLGIAVTDHIYRRYPDLAEGSLAKLRSALVNSNTLADVGEDLQLGLALLLGRGERTSGGAEKPSIVADAVEAVIGAVYLDAGQEAASALVLRLLGDRIVEAADGPDGFDAKTRLQERAARLEQSVEYVVVDSGPDHSKTFEAEVLVGGMLVGQGSGRSKKQAEQQAAEIAYERLSNDDT